MLSPSGSLDGVVSLSLFSLAEQQALLTPPHLCPDAINLTLIGTTVFVSMDLPDICLAFSKCLNYLDLQRTSEASFVFFLGVWQYVLLPSLSLSKR
jgi:hypothetical protein